MNKEQFYPFLSYNSNWWQQMNEVSQRPEISDGGGQKRLELGNKGSTRGFKVLCLLMIFLHVMPSPPVLRSRSTLTCSRPPWQLLQSCLQASHWLFPGSKVPFHPLLLLESLLGLQGHVKTLVSQQSLSLVLPQRNYSSVEKSLFWHSISHLLKWANWKWSLMSLLFLFLVLELIPQVQQCLCT